MSHLSGYGAYQLFLALRTHFNSNKYDFFQFHGKLKINKESYLKRHDKHFFEKIAKEFDMKTLRDFYIANLLKDKHYIMDFLDDEANTNLAEYLRRKQALSYNFANELDRVFNNSITGSFVIRNSVYPDIVGFFLRGTVSPETMVIINDFIPFIAKYDKYLGNDDPIWSKVSLKLKKYKPFLKYDSDKMKYILREKVDDLRRQSI